MSRPFSLLLIAFGTLFLIAFFKYHERAMDELHQDLFARTAPVQAETIGQKMEGLAASKRQLEAYIYEHWGSERFIPILDLIKKADQAREAFHQNANLTGRRKMDDSTPWVEQRHLLASMKGESNKVLEGMADKAEALLLAQHLDFDLSETHARETIERIRSAAQDAKLEIPTRSQRGTFLVERNLILLNFLNAQAEIISALTQLAGCKALHIDQVYPIVHGGLEHPLVGDTVRATAIAVMPNVNYAHTNVTLIVGTDTLAVDDNGKADFTFVPNRRGVHEFPTKCIVLNPLTGEVMTGDGMYVVRVH